MKDRCPVGPYIQNKPDHFGDVLIYEPCNYASNVAYFGAAMRMCDNENWSIDEQKVNAIKRGFLALGVGSSFWHASHTYVGYSFDNNMIAVLAALMHDAAVAPLPSNSTILKYLSRSERSENAVNVTENIIKMFSEKEISEWAEVLDKFDLPHDYEITFTATASMAFFVMFPEIIAYNIVYGIAHTVLNKE